MPDNLILRRLRRMAHWRCKEPVVVIESDDWGMQRRAATFPLLEYGEPGEWADEQTETADDLNRLYDVLSEHQDYTGRPACITANFVVGNPDPGAIISSHYRGYYEVPISENHELRAKWLEGMARNVFYPQYHARSHLSTERLLNDLRSDTPGARHLLVQGYHGGLSLLKAHGWRYHSEYINWQSKAENSTRILDNWISGGLNIFNQVFNFPSRSTIAPHYIFTPLTASAWKGGGIEFIQGTNYHILPRADGSQQIISHVLGERTQDRQLYLVRNIKFDPRPQRRGSSIEQVISLARYFFENQIPLVIDTHRINYTGAWAEQGLEYLGLLLEALRQFRPRFLSTVELGEAISQSGKYRDVWTNDARFLTPVDSLLSQLFRLVFAKYHRRVINNLCLH